MFTLSDVYKAFLAKVNEDDWASIKTEEDMEWLLADWKTIYESAYPYFKFPRCSLELNDNEEFIDSKMSQMEIQILAVYMKQEWIKRTVDSWENIKTQYEEKDFSQANLLKTFIQLRQQVNDEAEHLERLYSRSVNKKPFNYTILAGGNRGRGRY